MKVYELLFGVISIATFISSFKTENQIYKISLIFVSFLILVVIYLSSNMKNIKEIAESSSNEIKRLNEKIKIHEKLAEYDIRIKNLEGGFKK